MSYDKNEKISSLDELAYGDLNDKENIPIISKSKSGEHDQLKKKLSPEKNLVSHNVIEDLKNEIKDLKDQENDNSSKIFQKNNSDEIGENEILKIEKINIAIAKNDRHALIEYCKSEGGLINHDLRKIVWPKILKTDVVATSPIPDEKTIESHPYYSQVKLDVNRCYLRSFLNGENDRNTVKNKLNNLIMRVLINNPNLCYYQGFHDICNTFLLVLGEEAAFHIVDKLSKKHFRLFMEETLEGVQEMLELIPIIIEHEDKRLFEFLESSSVGNIFAFSWLITWFSHVIKSDKTVFRLFDLFLASHEYLPVYLSISLLLYKKDEILNLDCEMSSVFPFLNSLLENEENLPIEQLIKEANNLIKKYVPENFEESQKKRRKEKLEKEENVRREFRLKHSKKPIVNISKNVVVYGVATMVCLVAIGVAMNRKSD